MRLSRATPVLVLLVGALTSCGGDGGDAPAATPATVTATATATATVTDTVTETVPEVATETVTIAPESAPEPAPVDDGSDALAFFASTEIDCLTFAESVGNSPVPHSYFAGAQLVGDLGDDYWEIVDGAGNTLVVDLAGRVVFSIAGEEAVLPYEYSFGCPSDLYLGSAAD